MSFFKIIDKSSEPVRLFIGGVHGKEGSTTIEALNQINSHDVNDGKLLIYNCDESPYISTLDEGYYDSKIGKEILSLIKTYKPKIYVEPHCYKSSNYEKLTDKNRKEKVGVPPLIELKWGVLIGSVSPFVRLNCFKREDVCITLEVPCKPSPKALNLYTQVLKIVAGSKNRKEIEDKLKGEFPSQIKTARKYAIEFFGDYPPF
ncbi:MAG: DUF2119 domain-containing protein [Methanobacteriaceae archaeon]|nr:MAG: hypothetical protein CIT01_06860 [Methanobacterium sp. BRmetb2]MCC7558747.1 DUF2119 domain-containing protein [Methanobacteriaceae archaeon]